MDAIDRLGAEHQLIRLTLDAMDKCIAGLQATPDTARAELAKFVSFFREFAEHEHHAKEESVLFAAVTSARLPDDDEIVKSLLSEHETGRRYLLRLDELVSREGPWSPDHVEDAIHQARSYGLFLRSHVREEDGILFPLMRRRLAPAHLTQLGHGLDRFEASPGRTETRERLHRQAHELQRRHA
jgi:hemerythrin-like domain-containing protein